MSSSRQCHEELTSRELNRQVEWLRKKLGMKKIVRGVRRCLRCNKEFESEDVKANRMCGSCSKMQESGFEP